MQNGIPPRELADYFLPSSHNDPGSLPPNHRPGASSFVPPSSRKLLAETESTHNFLSWKILQRTSLF
jgi:hypothetical protein